MHEFPSWWNWPIEISPHAYRRMPVRGFTETDLRGMLAHAVDLMPDACPGRFLATCNWMGQRWHVIIEPDLFIEVAVVVTAFRVET